jgi:hypothetical protein
MAKADNPPTIDDEIKEIAREIEVRERLYPRWIEQNRISPYAANRRVQVMKSVLQRLTSMKEARSAQKT